VLGPGVSRLTLGVYTLQSGALVLVQQTFALIFTEDHPLIRKPYVLEALVQRESHQALLPVHDLKGPHLAKAKPLVIS
jgi:hypothetical protein